MATVIRRTQGGEVLSDDILHMGWLTKSPPLHQAHQQSVKSWRKRWFMMKKSKKALFYYSDEAMKTLKGEIDLGRCKTMVGYHYHPKYKWVFSCVCIDREYFLAVESEPEMTQWIEAIQSLWQDQVAELQAKQQLAKTQRESEAPLGPRSTPTISRADTMSQEAAYKAKNKFRKSNVVVTPDRNENEESDSDDEVFKEIDQINSPTNSTTSTPRGDGDGNTRGGPAMSFPPPPSELPPPPPSVIIDASQLCKVMYAFDAGGDTSKLTVTANQSLMLVQKDPDWTLVKDMVSSKQGYIPTSYLCE
eukprot:m.156551 g.156551  ORF g.156551 m.156551 type:complete len:304 (-) comp31003_c0_seq2:270-1181(-)